MSSSFIPAHPGVEILRERRVWSGRFELDLVTFRHRRFDGAMSGDRAWELFRLPALAAGLEPVMVEIPAGLCDTDEDPVQTVRREMVEEMGLSADLIEPIGRFVLTPGGSDETCSLFAGRVRAPAAAPDGLAGHGGLASEQEDIRVRVWPGSRAIEDAVAGRFANSVTSLALLWLAARRETLRAQWCRE